MDFDVVPRAGLTGSEFALLAGVSRVTTNNWMKGKMPHRYLQAKVSQLLRLLQLAVDHGELPLPPGGENRLDGIRAAMRAAAQKAKG